QFEHVPLRWRDLAFLPETDGVVRLWRDSVRHLRAQEARASFRFAMKVAKKNRGNELIALAPLPGKRAAEEEDLTQRRRGERIREEDGQTGCLSIKALEIGFLVLDFQLVDTRCQPAHAGRNSLRGGDDGM